MSDEIKTGAAGENLAADFLEKQGYLIVERNYRHRRAEIDLIAQRDNWLLFVEVKTRSGVKYGQPEQFVDLKKANMMFQAAEEYIFSKDWHGNIRFDVIAITLTKPPTIEHFEDAIN